MSLLATALRGHERHANFRNFDWAMLVTALVLCGFGLVAIWSADGAGPIALGSPVVRQAIAIVLGLGLMAAASWVDPRFVKALAWAVYGIALVGLVAVDLVGVTIGGARRWIDVGPITIQPSEPAKLAVLVALAAFVADRGPEMRRFVNFVLGGLIVLVPMALVYQQPDLGTAGCFAALWLAVMLVSPVRRLHLFAVFAAAPLVAVFAWHFVLHDYMRQRLLVSYQPERDYFGEGFNIIQAQIAIGTGGLFGNGLAGSLQSQLGLLRVRHTDFIFAHAMGMVGFVGGAALIAAYLLLLWRTSRVALLVNDLFGRALATGITGLLFFQAFVNMGMNVGLLPVTGVPLPFISLGGSAIWTQFAALGLLQALLTHRRRTAFGRD
ncbi:MAG: FtsW/RodA/SpoVE family cell cycle protein [Thermomicrobium sp.]|nr:FtsW/RodA/SpoVE family cell cycle protein [Thermomicrobium sp.]